MNTLKKITIITIYVLFSTIIIIKSNASEPELSLEQIVNFLRNNQTLEKIKTRGQIRKSKYDQPTIKHPFVFETNGHEIKITFEKANLSYKIQKFYDYIDIYKYQGEQENLITKKNNEEVNDDILDTGINIRDITFDFLYWEKNKLITDKAVLNKKFMYLIEFENDINISQNNKTRIYVDKKYLAINKIEFVNSDNFIYKEITINSIQKINNLWMPKQIKVKNYKQSEKKAKRKLAGISYIEFYKIK